MNLRLGIALAATLIGSINSALAQQSLLGRWRDAAPDNDPVGMVVIAKDWITLVRRNVTYHVKPIGAFGDGQLFEVTGLNRKQDPEGCGPKGKLRYIAVLPLPPVEPGVGGPAIRLFFYSGRSPPTVESIKNDIGLCSSRPFDR